MEITIEFTDEKPDYSEKKNIGLAILLKHDPSVEIHPGHDQIWVGDYEKLSAKMSGKEKVLLKKCGWFESEEAWSAFL